MSGLFGNLGDLIKLAQDPDFQKFLSNPKVQVLMKDPEFQKAVKEKNISALTTHPEFSEVMKDPEIQTALEKLGQK
jgi:glutamine amidotransferase PdxT